MSIFLKSAAGVLTALILWLCLNKSSRELSVLLTLTVCSMLVTAAMTVFQPVVDFLDRLRQLGNMESTYFSILMKVVGIGMLSEICSILCRDAGNETLSKTLQLLTSGVVLWLSIPVFEKLLSLLESVLEAVCP